jgi:K+-transporting ATPase ATPase C chain
MKGKNDMKTDATNIKPAVGSQADQQLAGGGNIGSHLYASIVATIALLIIVSGIYPLIVWGISQVIFPVQANGSFLKKDGGYTTNEQEAVGSELMGQNFTGAHYFHPRPSAAGAGYDGAASGGTNLGPLSDKLLNGVADNPETKDIDESYSGIRQLAAAYRQENALSENALVPADAVTRSGSGLDPHISVQNAQLQKARVARARGLDESAVQKAIDQNTDGRSFGILGEPGVNVLKLNLALDRLERK